MTFSSLLAEVETPLIIDTSVLINLQSCLRGEFILSKINNSVFSTTQVFEEIYSERSTHEMTKVFAKEMRESQLLREVSLTAKETEVFDRLSLQTGINLGIGEASTIAVALCRGYTAVIDEKKGRRIGRNELKNQVIGRTFDMLVHPNVQSQIGVKELRNVFICALQYGGMSVEKSETENVIQFIGVENAKKCPSLPGYQKLMDHWKKKIRSWQ